MNNGANDGAGYVNANNELSIVNDNYGFRVSVCLVSKIKYKHEYTVVTSWLIVSTRAYRISRFIVKIKLKMLPRQSRKLGRMKRVGYIFNAFVSYENLMLAHMNARKGKTHYKEVKDFEKDVKGNILKLQRKLILGTWYIN